MKYTDEIKSASKNPEQLEKLYQTSLKIGDEGDFRSDLSGLYTHAPDNILLAAWHYRFLHNPLMVAARQINWMLVIFFGMISGLALWLISDPDLLIQEHLPAYVLLWSPLATVFCLLYLALVSKRSISQFMWSGLILILGVGYILLMAGRQSAWLSAAYLDLMAIHLPLLCWISLGLALTGWKSTAYNRFAFLTKSIEVAIAAGLLLIFGLALGFLTIILFNTLNIDFPEAIVRLLAFGGFGMLPILAVAICYDPAVSSADQDFNQGLSKFISLLMRMLVPLTLLILVVYIFFIPFNFMVPFHDRDVLIIFNIVLFAIVAVLLGAAPLQMESLSPRFQAYLRKGILAITGLATVISAYAIAAVVYRSAAGITINRLTVIGWNTINLSIFISIFVLQLRGGLTDWTRRLHLVFNRATVLYALWCIFLIISIPLIFR